ncbi:keratin, type I cytoskeletal 10 [Anabrus simplex]|uniref:keratin, type I cytoskeletal 10 n=1 Tax=Anabrus simplex TaxID=316456 RepID=UPI0035A35BAD
MVFIKLLFFLVILAICLLPETAADEQPILLQRIRRQISWFSSSGGGSVAGGYGPRGPYSVSSGTRRSYSGYGLGGGSYTSTSGMSGYGRSTSCSNTDGFGYCRYL